MSRMQRVKDALASTVEKCRAEIEEIHAKGHYPADYSLGFANGLIFADYHVNDRQALKCYDRTTSIGKLPKPIALDTEVAPDEAEAEFAVLSDRALVAAKQVSEAWGGAASGPDAAMTDAMLKLEAAIKALEAFCAAQDKLEEAGKVEADGSPDAGSMISQGGSIPAPAASSGIEIGNACDEAGFIRQEILCVLAAFMCAAIALVSVLVASHFLRVVFNG